MTSALSVLMEQSGPMDWPWEELDASFQWKIVLTEEQKMFAEEYGIKECELEAVYRCPSFAAAYYDCSTVWDMCIWNFPSCWRKGYSFKNAPLREVLFPLFTATQILRIISDGVILQKTSNQVKW